jgi:hypothetical protein
MPAVRAPFARHGTRARYVRRRCRYERCVAANRTYQRDWQRRQREGRAFYLAVAVELFRRRAVSATRGHNGRP